MSLWLIISSRLAGGTHGIAWSCSSRDDMLQFWATGYSHSPTLVLLASSEPQIWCMWYIKHSPPFYRMCHNLPFWERKKNMFVSLGIFGQVSDLVCNMSYFLSSTQEGNAILWWDFVAHIKTPKNLWFLLTTFSLGNWNTGSKLQTNVVSWWWCKV